MDSNKWKLCQSCGMPMTPEFSYGTEADGSPSADYCSYCYDSGAFRGAMTMEEMIDFCAVPMARNIPGLSPEEARERMRQFFPQLKRWRK